jgi:hypothetical protein
MRAHHPVFLPAPPDIALREAPSRLDIYAMMRLPADMRDVGASLQGAETPGL